jgi:hypothetical protein
MGPAVAALSRRLPFFYGWVVVAVAFVTMAVGVNARTAFSPLFPPIPIAFGSSRHDRRRLLLRLRRLGGAQPRAGPAHGPARSAMHRAGKRTRCRVCLCGNAAALCAVTR